MRASLRSSLLAGLLLIPGLLAPAPVAAAPDHQLTLEEALGGGNFTRGVPTRRWRPGHAQTIELSRRPDPSGQRRRVLLARTPGGGEEVLADLGAAAALVPRPAPAAMRGIGRRGPPSRIFTPAGDAACLAVGGELVWMPFGGEPRRLTQTTSSISDVRVSPTGSHVAFCRDHDLWVVGTEAGAPRALTQGGSEIRRNASLDWVYPEELDHDTAIWWSPNGNRIAYLQLDETGVPRHRLPALLDERGEGRQMFYPRAGDRNPKARIGVVPVEGGETTWMALSAYEYVVRVTWTPDSKRVIVVTLDRRHQHLKVQSADPESGQSAVLHEHRVSGWIDTMPAPEFHDAHTMSLRLPTAEATRWSLLRTDATHEALVGAPLQISPVGFEARALLHVDLAARSALVAVIEHATGDEFVLASTWDAQGGLRAERSALTPKGPGSTSLSIDDTGTYAVRTRSSLLEPLVRDIVRVADGRVVETLGEGRGPRFDIVKPARVASGRIPVAGANGDIRWRLWMPVDVDPTRKYPLYVNVYGGPGSRMVRPGFGRGPWFPTYLTQQGYGVLEVDGRGTGGQAPAFAWTVRERLGVLEVEDQARAVRHVAAAHPWIDTKRVGIFGWSYGGTMAANGLTMQSGIFHVGVAVAPVTSWRYYDTIYTERYMDTPQNNPEGYRVSSSVERASQIRGQLLLVHGLGDDNVHALNSFALLEALIACDRLGHVETMFYPARGHGIGGVGNDVFRRALDFFARHLAPVPGGSPAD